MSIVVLSKSRITSSKRSITLNIVKDLNEFMVHALFITALTVYGSILTPQLKLGKLNKFKVTFTLLKLSVSLLAR